MQSTHNCSTCRFSDWGYKLKPYEKRLPCEQCIGFSKWAKKEGKDE